MERNLNDEYPYGKFPTKYTKIGQQKYFEQLTSDNLEDKVSVMNTTNVESQNNDNSQYSNQQNSFDISKLLPLLKMMSSKKNISNNDMLQMMLPLLGGENMSQMADIMQLFNKDQPTEEPAEDIEKSPTTKIDDYKRVE